MGMGLWGRLWRGGISGGGEVERGFAGESCSAFCFQRIMMIQL